jgi:hypothetical protein
VEEALDKNLIAITGPDEFFPGLSHLVSVVDIDPVVCQLRIAQVNLGQPTMKKILPLTPFTSR